MPRPKTRFEILRGNNRKENDFYPTPRRAVEELAYRVSFYGTVLEPADGQGDISNVLREFGYYVFKKDIKDGDDFLISTTCYDNIITNPPYKHATEFLDHALSLAHNKVAFLMPLEYLAGRNRGRLYRDKEMPLTKVIVFPRRLCFLHDETTGKGKPAPMGSGWYVFERDRNGLNRKNAELEFVA